MCKNFCISESTYPISFPPEPLTICVRWVSPIDSTIDRRTLFELLSKTPISQPRQSSNTLRRTLNWQSSAHYPPYPLSPRLARTFYLPTLQIEWLRELSSPTSPVVKLKKAIAHFIETNLFGLEEQCSCIRYRCRR